MTLDAPTRPCWISAPGSRTLRQCGLVNISGRGATLSSESAFPETFDLFLTLDADKGRQCRVMMRDGICASVEFVDHEERAMTGRG